jgi:general nucleoside transport system ATP-binding protein
MCDGEITGTVNGADADEATLGMMMANALETEEKMKGAV